MTEQELLKKISDLVTEAGYQLDVAVRLPAGELVSPRNFIQFPLTLVLVKNGDNQTGLEAQPDNGIDNRAEHGVDNRLRKGSRS